MNKIALLLIILLVPLTFAQETCDVNKGCYIIPAKQTEPEKDFLKTPINHWLLPPDWNLLYGHILSGFFIVAGLVLAKISTKWRFLGGVGIVIGIGLLAWMLWVA